MEPSVDLTEIENPVEAAELEQESEDESCYSLLKESMMKDPMVLKTR